MNPEQVSRAIFWNISKEGEYLFFVLSALAIALCFYGFRIQLRRIFRGKKGAMKKFRIWTVGTSWTWSAAPSAAVVK